MKILTLSNYYPEHQGGIEFVAMNLVKHWRTHHQVRWMACDVKEHPHNSGVDDIPLRALNFAEHNLGFPYPIPVGKSLFEIFREVKASDVVHVHDCLYLANVFAFLASRWYRKPLLVTQHVALVPYSELYKNAIQKAAYWLLGKLVLENAQQVVFISQRVRAWFQERLVFRHPPLLIPNGVDREIFFPPRDGERELARTQLGFSTDDIVLIFVGRFAQKKGLGLIRDLAQARPNLNWILIGRDELDPRTWKLPNVQVIPPQPQEVLRKYYVAADLFFLPSIGEGFPLAIQESLSCGLPAAVSNEISEYAPEAPFLKIEERSPEFILGMIDNLFSMPGESLEALRKASAEYAARWDWANVARQYENLFASLVSPG
jgi:glycosyltransferase involved in cell wall biosynthesis